MSRFETRKKLLVAESEVYRQMLKIEIQTFKVYGMQTKRRLTSVSSYLPLIISGVPVLSSLFRRKKKESSLMRMGSLLLAGWKAYQRFAPLFGRGEFPTDTVEPDETAAEEYLSKRL